MGIKKMALVAAVGLSMASAPVMAQTAPVSRSAPSMEESNGQVESGTSTYIIAFFVVVAVGLGLYFAFNNDDDGRTSP